MNEKTLLYLASGPIIPEYKDLPFGKMIFVDRENQRVGFRDDRIEFIHADSLAAIQILSDRGIKIDYLVSVNEGLWEGGGNYPVLSDFMLGYLSPILSDEFFLVCYPEYYNSMRMKLKPDWGFKKKIVNFSDPAFVYPSLFSYEQRSKGLKWDPNFGKVFKMNRIRNRTQLNLNQNLNCQLIYGSIWDDAPQLDLLGISLLSRHDIRMQGLNHYSIDQFFSERGVYDLRGKTIQEIVAHAEANGLKRIGLCPWMDGEYAEVIQFLRDLKPGCIESIYFYHLEKRDFRQIYELTQA